MKKSLVSLLFLSLLVITINGQALAEGNGDSSIFEKFKSSFHKKTTEEIEKYKQELRQQKQNVETRQVEVEEKKEQRILNLCEVLGERVQNKISMFEKHKDDHVANYQKAREKLQKIVNELEAKGYDVTELRTDLVKFDTMIKDYAQLYMNFIDSLKNTQGYACGESDGDYKDALSKSHELLRQLQEKRKELRFFYRDEIREDIKDLRKQAREQLVEMNKKGLTEENSE